ncbi:SIR2 family protein [Enterococcus hirae]|uniref:SIR2 family protein n=1 Tax=Enterococcus hirae TaxID=1354 RepID=UPI001F256D6A|nr:SIR2 family protein [Enterococcus hirae]
MSQIEEINYYQGSTKEKKSLSEVQKTIAQAMQMENLSILMGAGCSSFYINDKEAAISTMAGLFKDFIEQHQDFKILGVSIEDKVNQNLEELMDFMNALRQVNHIKEIDEEIDNKINMVKEFITDKVIRGMNCRELSEIYKKFYLKTISSSRKSPVNIVTTNYDMYNERALDELNFIYNNGFSGSYMRTFNPNIYKYMYVDNMNLNKDIWNRVDHFYNLYKIHGSISWKKSEDKIYEVSKNEIDKKFSENVMIYPTPLKDRSTLMVPYTDLMRSFQDNLTQKNSVLITLGYSFGDDHINRIILNNLSIPSFRLIILGDTEYENDAGEKIDTNIGKIRKMDDSRIVIINSENKIHYFKNFVEKLMPSIPSEEQEKQKISDKISKVFSELNESGGNNNE